MKKLLWLVIAGALAMPVMSAAGSAGAAVAKAPVVKTGQCSGSSTWRLTLKMDNGRIEADSEVNHSTAGQVWNSTFRDNGTVFGHASVTAAADGSADPTRYAQNRAGKDLVTVRSKNQTTGEVCIAKATF
jgi:hypothetical protein